MSSDQRWELSTPQVVADTIDGEVVAVDLGRGSYYSLRGSGAAAWELLVGGWTVAEAAAELARRYDAPAETVESEVGRLAAELAEEGLLRLGAGNPGDLLEGVLVGGGAFEAPVREKFTDMEDLLLLDPVHDVDALGWPHPVPGPER